MDFPFHFRGNRNCFMIFNCISVISSLHHVVENGGSPFLQHIRLFTRFPMLVVRFAQSLLCRVLRERTTELLGMFLATIFPFGSLRMSNASMAWVEKWEFCARRFLLDLAESFNSPSIIFSYLIVRLSESLWF